MSMRTLLWVLSTSVAPRAAAFGNPYYFTDQYLPSTRPDVRLKVPKFDVVLDDVRKASPLAWQVLTQHSPGGLAAIDDVADEFWNGRDATGRIEPDVYRWTVLEKNPERPVSRIDAIPNFMGRGPPLQRFRATLRAPAQQQGFCFSELVSETALRTQWDATCASVDQLHSAADLTQVRELQARCLRESTLRCGKDSDILGYGEPLLFGIGHVRTKRSVVSPREQLTLCGLQRFPSGATITWGIELEEDQNHLFPADQPNRRPRSTSHLFAMTTAPRREDPTLFDVEYVLQVEVGGIPTWISSPLVLDAVKKMFRFAEGYGRSGFEEGGALARRLAALPDDAVGAAAEDDAESAEGVTPDDADVLAEAREAQPQTPPRPDGRAPRATEGGDAARALIAEHAAERERLEGLVASYERDRESFRKSAKVAAQALDRKLKRMLGAGK